MDTWGTMAVPFVSNFMDRKMGVHFSVSKLLLSQCMTTGTITPAYMLWSAIVEHTILSYTCLIYFVCLRMFKYAWIRTA